MYRLLVRLLFIFFKDPESVHHLALFFLKVLGLPGIRNVTKVFFSKESPALVQDVFGLRFGNPVGLAAGFDKEGEVISGLEALGFGHVEAGTITKRPQPGNPRPRLFKFDSEHALINRMGFNNRGAEVLARTLHRRRFGVPIGISIGKSKVIELEDAANDYLASFQVLYEYGDYFVINVSSPNTPGLRTLQDKAFLVGIVTVLNTFRNRQEKKKPLLVKIAPDLSFEAIDEVLTVCKENRIDGIVAVNTSVARHGVSKTAAGISGGLSGLPIKNAATEIIRYIHAKAPQLPIIGVGGIFTAEDAYQKIRAGASLVQVYTGFIYEGPGIAGKINKGIAKFLERDGYKNIAEAVGKG